MSYFLFLDEAEGIGILKDIFLSYLNKVVDIGDTFIYRKNRDFNCLLYI